MAAVPTWNVPCNITIERHAAQVLRESLAWRARGRSRRRLLEFPARAVLSTSCLPRYFTAIASIRFHSSHSDFHRECRGVVRSSIPITWMVVLCQSIGCCLRTNLRKALIHVKSRILEQALQYFSHLKLFPLPRKRPERVFYIVPCLQFSQQDALVCSVRW